MAAKANKKDRCYIYIRVSTNMQVEGYSLDAQKDRILKFAEYQNMEIVGEYCDAGKSGKSVTGRPEFTRMLEDIESGVDNIDYVLVFKLSRFGRNAADVLNSLQLLQDYGVELICVEDGIDSSKDSGKLTITVLSAVAEIERENILVQTMEGRKQKAREGKWNGGVPPYGYMLDSDNEMIVIDPDTVDTVKLIYEQYVYKDMGLEEIVRFLNEHGYKKKQYRKRDLNYFTAHFIRNVLDNPVYTGKISYGRLKTEKVKGSRDEFKRVKNTDFMLSDGLHDAIISEELWELAQTKRRRVAKRTKKKYAVDHVHLLSGLVKCPVCGEPMTGTTAKRKNKNTGDYDFYFYYRCHNRKILDDGGVCDFKSNYNEEALDTEVYELVKCFVNGEGCRDMIMEQIDRKVDVSTLEAEREQLRLKLRQVKGAKDKLQEKMDALDVSDRFYERKYEDMNERWANLYDKINSIEESIRGVTRKMAKAKQDALSSQQVYDILLNFEKLYEKMSDEERRRFYELLIKEIEVHQDRGRNDRMVKSILFKFPIFYNGETGDMVCLPKEKTVETVVKLSLKKDTPKIEVTMEPDEESNYTPEEKITYQKIKAYILEKYGFKVSSLYIAQIKDKCGLGKERTGNNWKKNDKSKEPQCTPEKEEAIRDAFKNFNII